MSTKALETNADLDLAVRAMLTGRIDDPEHARQIHAEADAIRQEILKTHGELNIAVELVRETRDRE